MVIIIIEPFGVPIFLFTSAKELIKVGKEKFNEDYTDYTDTANGLAIYAERTFLMLLPKRYKERIVWHEAHHMTLFILEHYRINLTDKELQAHLQGHIVREIKRKLYNKKVLHPFEE